MMLWKKEAINIQQPRDGEKVTFDRGYSRDILVMIKCHRLYIERDLSAVFMSIVLLVAVMWKGKIEYEDEAILSQR